MSSNVKGPAIFLAQFVDDSPPFNSWSSICKWAAEIGYEGVQIPTWDLRLFDLDKAAASKDYCDEIKGVANEHGLTITELSTHLQGQLVAVHPAFDEAFDSFAPPAFHGKPRERQAWAVQQMKNAAKASQHLGLPGLVSFTGALAWPFVYPFPARSPGLVETAFAELGRRWKPILDAFDDAGVDIGFEIHPSEDVFDGTTFERFLDAVNGHPRCGINYDPSHFVLQQLDYLAFIDIYHERITAFHVKDAEFNSSGRQGVYSGYAPWIERAGRFRSLGDGQVDFGAIFSKMAQYGYDRWAVLEWECCLKHPEDGAREGAEFIRRHLIRVTERAFDDFAGGAPDQGKVERLLGLGSGVQD
ncbi:MAG: sugar phosphate isomerase/epimerase [Rhizobiaceae bacterium]|nr:sugar phosphate isomerase/epimerase [Rhizobiaceae bacterium]